MILGILSTTGLPASLHALRSPMGRSIGQEDPLQRCSRYVEVGNVRLSRLDASSSKRFARSFCCTTPRRGEPIPKLETGWSRFLRRIRVCRPQDRSGFKPAGMPSAQAIPDKFNEPQTSQLSRTQQRSDFPAINHPQPGNNGRDPLLRRHGIRFGEAAARGWGTRGDHL